jgi:ATP/ADP translocase
MITTLATNRNAPKKKKKKTLVSTHFWTFVQLYVTAEVYDLLMHVAYWELSALSPTSSSPRRATPHTLLTFSAVVMSLSALIMYSSRPASLGKHNSAS